MSYRAFVTCRILINPAPFLELRKIPAMQQVSRGASAKATAMQTVSRGASAKATAMQKVPRGASAKETAMQKVSTNYDHPVMGGVIL